MPVRHRRRKTGGALCAALLAGIALTSSAHAALVLDKTRVIVTQTDGKSSFNVSNSAKRPVLVQTWVEPGEASIANVTHASPVRPATPFIVDPPMVRLDGEDTRALQVWFTHTPYTLPENQESQFWLNVLEIPAEETLPEDTIDQSRQNRLDITIMTRIKLFYRPKKLADYQASDAEKLHFTIRRDAQKQAWLGLHNPAPVYQNLDKLVVQHIDGEKSHAVALDAPMLAPFSEQHIPLPSTLPVADKMRITFTTIGDRGELLQAEQVL